MTQLPMFKNRSLVYLTVFGLTLLAALLRLPWLDRLPPGLYHDEAYNGLDALAINEGRHAIFFEANYGREPLHIYYPERYSEPAFVWMTALALSLGADYHVEHVRAPSPGGRRPARLPG